MKIAVIYKKFFVFFNISLISAILFSLFNFFLPNLDPITIDSQSYLNHHTLRTPGYPLFLKICYFFSSNNLEFVCLIQQLFLIISGSICFQVCSIFFRRKEFCVFLGILAIGNPLMWKYSNLILS